MADGGRRAAMSSAALPIPRMRWIALLVALMVGVMILIFAVRVPPSTGDAAPGTVPARQEPGSAALDRVPPPDDTQGPATINERNAWTPVAVGGVEASRIPAYKEAVVGRALVSLSSTMWDWKRGDRVSIVVPQIGQTYSPVIERVETVVGNNRTYSGRLVQDERPHSFVITVGERNVFANLSTPHGQFELVGNTELAWLMPMANMDQHVDYTQPDYILGEARDDGP